MAPGALSADLTSPVEPRSYRYYDFLMAAFVTVLLASNLVGPGKVGQIGGITFRRRQHLLPADLHLRRRPHRGVRLRARAAGHLRRLRRDGVRHDHDRRRAAPAAQSARALERHAAAGDFVNSYVLAKLKIATRGRWLWMRTIGSTIAGQGIDSVVFYPLAFAGVWSGDVLSSVVVFNWGFKVGVEVLMTPVTYAVVGFLKRAEGEDYYDVRTNFTPFSLRT